MRFRKMSDYHGTSECGRYTICKANSLVGGAYTAARHGKPDVLLASFRFDGTDESRQEAWRKAVLACEEDAARDGS